MLEITKFIDNRMGMLLVEGEHQAQASYQEWLDLNTRRPEFVNMTDAQYKQQRKLQGVILKAKRKFLKLLRKNKGKLGSKKKMILEATYNIDFLHRDYGLHVAYDLGWILDEWRYVGARSAADVAPAQLAKSIFYDQKKKQEEKEARGRERMARNRASKVKHGALGDEEVSPSKAQLIAGELRGGQAGDRGSLREFQWHLKLKYGNLIR